MRKSIPSSWQSVLTPELEKSYFQELEEFVTGAYQTDLCFPPKTEIFSAFDFCPFDQVKVVIIGQDPYHGPNQANGLCFSVKKGEKHPPSLVNIFRELQTDMNIPYPQSGDLSAWAKQGVLMLNATLTVKQSEAGSHQKQGWETFTDAVIAMLSEKKNNVVFMLWGGYAKKRGAKIDRSRHLVLETGHPSPLSANRGFWFGNQHFSKCNSYLKKQGKTPINWSLEQSQGLLFT